MSRIPYFTIDDDTDDLSEIDTPPALPSTSLDDGSIWTPTLPKCEHCDDNGQVVASTYERVDPRLPGRVVSNRTFEDCPECNGMGFIGVPTDQDAKQQWRDERRRSDVCLLMRARLHRGLDLWTGERMPNTVEIA